MTEVHRVPNYRLQLTLPTHSLAPPLMLSAASCRKDAAEPRSASLPALTRPTEISSLHRPGVFRFGALTGGPRKIGFTNAPGLTVSDLVTVSVSVR